MGAHYIKEMRKIIIIFIKNLSQQVAIALLPYRKVDVDLENAVATKSYEFIYLYLFDDNTGANYTE